MRWDATSLALTGGTNREVVDPAGWLEAYWMARWLGMVLEENDA
jgi:hypothetical protein